jgi:hypothetical protein
MVSLPSAPVQKNGLVPLVANVALVVEIEKVNAKLDVVIVNLAKINDIILQGVGDADPVPVVPSVPSASLVSELMDTDIPLHEEIRNEARKTRDCMEKCSTVVILFITVMYMIHTHTVVSSIKEPVVCESFPPMFKPFLNCTVVTDWVMKAKFFTSEFTKSAHDDWAH